MPEEKGIGFVGGWFWIFIIIILILLFVPGIIIWEKN
ncbi:MAG: Uncharacterized protein XD65_0394 [Caldanaerobacter subterraneus]|jgi:competence protein ComGC|uniref:Uncharacterized protein n=1 Tax=Thermoanaerobacter brockii subsp. finnii (strain ATCC 43586 / DSM 3389 / AKO-1) TaxID=509193 RepID=E8UVX4_THEBF|nr:hypothetical protein Thebr_1764 [Thermoanaerobacter brockii subsp. finnii Ako-1]KHO61097.1 hypothetical protein THYS13_26740 [Thermoanaerobacter sp. YS13]KUJ90308.1 MAG: hypothetical protein XD37_1484 [Thermoanaerobacter thermocopriae]KUK35273.1 MAG: Uncharacterized protein XD65_0394 [Caldanaerobacter subterraneus]MBZ4655620.1 hypothetical protein [Thermoanaerobacter sp.]